MHPRPIRVFVSSPGDVPAERAAALAVIAAVGRDPLLFNRATLIPVSWDQPGAGVPMFADRTPQDSVNLGLLPPSACEVVVVILSARMGTPLPVQDYRKPNGQPYRSGTEWEFCDAVAAARENGGVPYTLTYRRQPTPPGNAQQLQALNDFFREHFQHANGSLAGGYSTYPDPAGFQARLETDLRATVRLLLDHPPTVVSVAELRNATTLILQRRGAEALPILLAQSRIAPTNPRVLFAQALALFRGLPIGVQAVKREQVVEAVKLLKLVGQARPDDARIDFTLGLIRRHYDEEYGASSGAPPLAVTLANIHRKPPPVDHPHFADLIRLLTTNQ